MGTAVYPVIEGADDGWPDDINGKALARSLRWLDQAAKVAAVQPLMAFYSMTIEQMEAEGIEGESELWFDSGDGLKTVQALLEYTRGDAKHLENRDLVVEDLEAFERHLQRGHEMGKRWHLALDC